MHYSLGFIYDEVNVLKSFQRIGRCFTDLNVFSSSFICYSKIGKYTELTLKLLWMIHLKSSVNNKFVGESTESKCFFSWIFINVYAVGYNTSLNKLKPHCYIEASWYMPWWVGYMQGAKMSQCLTSRGSEIVANEHWALIYMYKRAVATAWIKFVKKKI